MPRRLLILLKPKHAPFAVFAVIGLAIGIGFALLIFVYPPLEYTQKYYTPDKAVYAPGDTVMYSPALRGRTWGPYTFTRSFKLRSGGAARLCDGTLTETYTRRDNVLYEEVNTYREPLAPVNVPNLPPGSYVITGSIEGNGRASMYEVFFRIEQPCGNDG